MTMPRERPPEGYLGAGARITSGPAPELIEAGYALEIGDAPLLHRGLTLADLAHLIALVECGALRREGNYNEGNPYRTNETKMS